MRDDFQIAMNFVFQHEGNYSYDEDDPGGETHWGISKKAYPDLDIKNLTQLEAAQIYKTDYWDKVQADIIPFPRDIIAMDTAVNCGVSRALVFLTESGSWQEQLFKRMKYYVDLCVQRPVMIKYFFGWSTRIMDLYSLIKKASK